MFILSNFLFALAQLLDIVLDVYFWVVLLSIILSWIPLDPYNPTAQSAIKFLRRATEPVFDFFKRTLQLSRLQRYTAPLDFTPFIVILAIYFLRSFVVLSLKDIAQILR